MVRPWTRAVKQIPTSDQRFGRRRRRGTLAQHPRYGSRTRDLRIPARKRGISRRREGRWRRSTIGARSAFDGRSSARVAAQALQHPYRGCVCRMDRAVHPGQWSAASARPGQARGRGVPVDARGAREGGGEHAEPGAVGAVVPLSRGARAEAAVDGRRDPRQAAGAASAFGYLRASACGNQTRP